MQIARLTVFKYILYISVDITTLVSTQIAIAYVGRFIGIK